MNDHHIVIADDHPLFREALRQTLEGQTGAAVSEAGSLAEAVGLIEGDRDIDLVLLDLKMPGVQGFSGLIFLRNQFPHVPVVVVSASEDPPIIRRAMALGASGFIPKTLQVSRMKDAVRRVLDGEIWVPDGIDLGIGGDPEGDQLAQRLATLTPQQMRVLMMLREGLLNKQIAYQLSVSEATVKAHVSAILQKLDVDSRTQAVIAASRIDGLEMPANHAG
ncbi:MAG: response regulator transcription factor [Hyphomicrobiales bacterium]